MGNFPRLRKLAGKNARTTESSFRGLANGLKRADGRGLLHLRIQRGKSWTNRGFKFDGTRCRVTRKLDERPDVVVMMQDDTYRRIVSGELSPVDAFYDGAMRFRGRKAVAQAVLDSLMAAGEPAFEFCDKRR